MERIAIKYNGKVIAKYSINSTDRLPDDLQDLEIDSYESVDQLNDISVDYPESEFDQLPSDVQRGIDKNKLHSPDPPVDSGDLYRRFKKNLTDVHNHTESDAMDKIDNLLNKYASLRMAVDARNQGDAKNRVDKDQASNSPVLASAEASDLKDIIDGKIK